MILGFWVLAAALFGLLVTGSILMGVGHSVRSGKKIWVILGGILLFFPLLFAGFLLYVFGGWPLFFVFWAALLAAGVCAYRGKIRKKHTYLTLLAALERGDWAAFTAGFKNCRDANYNTGTPLIVAAAKCPDIPLELLDILLEYGADADMPDKDGHTAAHYAAQNHRQDALALLQANMQQTKKS